MQSDKNVLVISSSNGENLKLAKRFVSYGESIGISSHLLNLTDIELPLFNPKTQNDLDVQPTINELRSQMISYTYWIICAPEYNGSIPPILTNAIAWLSIQENDFRQLFNGRPIAMASVSGGGCMELLISLRIQLTHLGAQVLGRHIASNNRNAAKDESIKDVFERLIQMNPLDI